MAEPVVPPIIGVPDLRALLDHLGATSHPVEVDAYELTLNDGLRLDVEQDPSANRVNDEADIRNRNSARATLSAECPMLMIVTHRERLKPGAPRAIDRRAC